MADGALAQSSATETTTAATTPANPTPPAGLFETKTEGMRQSRKARAAEAMKGRKPNQPRASVTQQATTQTDTAKPVEAAKPTETAATTQALAQLDTDSATEKPVESKATEVKATPAADQEDERTKRGIAAIERREKEFRERQARDREELELSRSEIARMKSELEGKTTSLSQLKGMKPARLAAELRALGYGSSEFDALSRVSWALTENGAKDPKAVEAARQAETMFSAKEHEDTIAELRKQIDELKGEFTKRDESATVQRTQAQWIDTTIKALPTDKPTLLGKYLEKSPEVAKRELLELGIWMEADRAKREGIPLREATPTAAEVLAEFENHRRAYLEAHGVDVESMLKPAAPKQEQKPAQKQALGQNTTKSRTLDVSQPSNGTRPHESKTRPMSYQERVKHAAELRKSGTLTH